ncbi:MAG: PEPxxWA-CTERM sorting domain-containing protein [Thiobacillus sp.]|nr:PEPxxWA-CTERM sorting domain-containing protein [Thiobacillus sp.]
MLIDTAGNYHIAKQDMSFGYYDKFEYRDTTKVNPDQSYDTRINFKPYTVSDAKGWCGSVLTPNPGGLAQMAGQVTFDFAMDVYFDFGGTPIYSSTQLVPGFVMRSYGDYTVNVTTPGGDQQVFEAHAVGNNTNPESIVEGVGGTLDPAFQNDVSFLGAGVLPAGVWVSADSFESDGKTRKMRTDFNATTGESTEVWDVTIVEAGTAGAVWHSNAYAGFAYVLRADGMRILDYVNPTGHSDYVATVPEPESYAMMLLGVGLVGMAVRRRRSA